MLGLKLNHVSKSGPSTFLCPNCIVDLSQLALVMVWGSPLQAWLPIANLITWARHLNTNYSYEARGMYNPISWPQYSQNKYTYNKVV